MLTRFRRWLRGEPLPEAPKRAAKGPILLPTEPNVFECRACGKVFETKRRRAVCPECDSDDTELLTG